MSNKTTLQSHNERLQDLIDIANSLPDAGNGGSVETFTLNFGYMDDFGGNIGYSKYENGMVSPVYESHGDFANHSNCEVVSGSLIFLQCNDDFYFDEDVSYGYTTFYKNDDNTIVIFGVNSEDHYIEVTMDWT